MLIPGALEVGVAFHEAQLAYVHGLWFSTIFNATVAIERNIASLLRAIGTENIQQLSFSGLTALAEQSGHIDHYEKTKYDELHELRNSYARYHDPNTMIERLAEEGRMGIGINELLQADARMALTLVCGYFEKNCLPEPPQITGRGA
jgi:hypothetical protein